MTAHIDRERRYWELVDTRGGPDACWPFMGPRTPKGYGQIGKTSVHRLALELAGRPATSGEIVMHSCDNPPCANPAHLSTGTYADNSQDMVRKGRHGRWTKPERTARGARHGAARLTVEQVRAIREGCRPARETAALFGVSDSQVRRIRHRVHWRDV